MENLSSDLKNLLAEIDTIVIEGKKNLGVFSFSHRKLEATLPQIEEKVDVFVQNLITTYSSGATITPACKEKLLENVEDRRSKLHLSTGITDQIIGICQSILSFGAGGLALSIAFIDKASKLSVPVQKYLAIAGIFYTELVLVSIFSLILYLLQARFRYPSIYFTKIGNTWPWFYYASISPDVPRGPIQLSRNRLEASRFYAQDLAKFTENTLNEDFAQKLRNEIQQYFLLISYQGYVNQFSLRLANFFMYGFVGAFLSALILIILVVLVNLGVA